MKILKRTMVGVYLSIMIILVSGCWDNMDINERAFVAAVGMDKGEEKSIEVSIQILRPKIVKGKEEEDSKNTILVSTTTGNTIFEAIREHLKSIHRRPYYTQLRLIAIGEELAKEGIEDIIDFFLRDHEVRITPKIIIVKDFKAKDLINTESKFDDIPALHFEGLLENNKTEAITRTINLIDVVHELTDAHGSGVIATVIAENKESFKEIQDLKIEGSAVFRKDKLIGYLDRYQTRGYLFIKDEVEEGVIHIDNPKEKGKQLAIEILRASGDMDVDMNDGELMLKVKVKLTGGLSEQQGSTDLANEETLEQLEKEVEKAIENNIKSIIDVGQKTYKVDFFGFGNKIYRKYPHYWNEVKYQWDEEFTKLPIEINIKAHLDRTGTFSKPIQIN